MPTEDHQKTSWWATDLGKCLRGVYYARQGVEAPEKLTERNYRVFKVGHLFEEWVIDTISKAGNGIKIERPETIRLKDIDLSVRPDLIVTLSDNERVLYEIKSVHSQKFWWMNKKGEGPDQHYLMQTWMGLKATGIQEGRLIYFSKDDLCVQEFPLRLDDKELEQACMRNIGILQTSWTNQQPPEPEPAIVDGKINWKAKYCSYHTLCLNDPCWLAKAEKEVNNLKKSKNGNVKSNTKKTQHLPETGAVSEKREGDSDF